MARTNYHPQPRIVVEQSPWQTFFDKLPDMLLSFQKLRLQAEEREAERQFQRANMYIRDNLETDRMLKKELIQVTKENREAGLKTNIGLDAITGAARTKNSEKVSSHADDMRAYHPNNLSDALAKAVEDRALIKKGASDAVVMGNTIDRDGNSILSQKELHAYQKANPEILKTLGVDQFPVAYIAGIESHLGKPEVKKSRKALADLTRMLEARVADADPNVPGLQLDPSDLRVADIQNVLDMIELEQLPAAAAALKKISPIAQDPFARQRYTPVEQTFLEEAGLMVGTDPRMGAIVKRSEEDIMASEEFLNLIKQRQAAIDSIDTIQALQEDPSSKYYIGPNDPNYLDPGYAHPEQLEQNDILDQTEEQIEAMLSDTDVSRQEAAQTIMTRKDMNRQLKLLQDKVKLSEDEEEVEKESFEGVQAAKYKSAHNWFRSGPLRAKRTGPGKYTEDTSADAEKILEDSEVLYSLLSDPSWHPTEGGEHKSPAVMKEYQKKIEEYIIELMNEEKGYKPDSALRTVFEKGMLVSKYQGARNVLNSPTFRQAVDPLGNGTYDKKEASKKLNALFDFHGWKIGGINKASLAQGEAIAHLYSIWKGLEDEQARRKGIDLDKLDQQRIRDKIISG